MLSRSQPISYLAATHQVSWKFVYQQNDKTQQTLTETFLPTPADDDVLLHLPVTKSWLFQLTLDLVLSGIEVGLHNEIYQADKPILVGIDTASTYCYLLESVEHQNEDTWGCHLLNGMEQGFEPDYTIYAMISFCDGVWVMTISNFSVFSQSSPVSALSGAGASGEKSEAIADRKAVSTMAGDTRFQSVLEGIGIAEISQINH